jgi:DNA-binding winged helix-turn-helix (wHTH) protein/pimeloyl-ACP methyl ester carboxylesterase
MVYLFGPFELDTTERRLLRSGVAVPLRPKLFDTLCALIEQHGHLVRKDELIRSLWPDSIVGENSLDHNISRLRRLLGDGENGIRYIETVPRQGYRFIATLQSPRPVAISPPVKAATPAAKIEQQIHFLAADEGAQLAYSKIGSGPVLLKSANWLNHLEFELQSPLWQHWINLLSAHNTLVRYDERGNGLSSWNVQTFSFDAWCRDLQLVAESLKLKKFSLLGISQGAAVAVWYAATYPKRVDRLVLYGGFARGFELRHSPAAMERIDAMITLMRLGWGKNNPAFRQLFTTIFMPDALPEHMAWFNELQCVSTSPENAVQFMEAFKKVNAVDLLPKVKCPTLVVHCDRDSVTPISESRMMASRISGARFVSLPSKNHILIESEPAWPRFVKELTDFMGWPSPKQSS